MNSHETRDMNSEIMGDAGGLWYEYKGDPSPGRMRTLAREHGLKVVHCGANLVSKPE